MNDDLDEGCGEYYYSSIGYKKCGDIDKKWYLTISRFYCPNCKKKVKGESKK